MWSEERFERECGTGTVVRGDYFGDLGGGWVGVLIFWLFDNCFSYPRLILVVQHHESFFLGSVLCL